MKPPIARIPLVPALCIAFLLSAPPLFAVSYTITVNGAAKQDTVPHFWSECVGTGTMWFCQKPEWRTAMKIGVEEAGFRRVRGHGILMGWDNIDRVGIFSWNGTGTPVYRWSTFDSIFDFLVKECKLKPIVELSFMPKDLQSTTQISKPKNLTVYRDMIKEIVQHCVTRYGLEAVRSWYWEVWNEYDYPGFWSGNAADYYQMYQKAAEGVKSVDAQIRVGGPATTGAGGIAGFISFCKTNNVKYDFVSNHNYGGGGNGPNADPVNVRNDNRTRANAIKNSGQPSTHSLNTEYSSSWSGQGGKVGANTISMDSHINAPFVVKCIKLILDDHLAGTHKLPEALSYWAVSDVFDESTPNNGGSYVEQNNFIPFAQVFGLVNYQGVRKATFNAFKLLNMMGSTRLSLSGGTGELDGVDGFATVNADGSVVTVILYNFYKALAGQTAIDDVNFTLNSLPLPRGQVQVRHYRIDTTHSNAYGIWVKQGKPIKPTTTQWNEMHAASSLAEMYAAKTINYTGSAYTETFALPRQSVSMVQFKSASAVAVNRRNDMVTTPLLSFSKGIITVSGMIGSVQVEASVYGLDGKLIAESSTRTGTVNVRRLVPNRGAYLVRASCGAEQLVTIFVLPE